MLDAQARLGNQGATALAQRMGRSGSGGHGGLREDALAEQPDGLTAVLARRVMDPSKAANASFADADAFKAHGPFGPSDVIEGTGGPADSRPCTTRRPTSSTSSCAAASTSATPSTPAARRPTRRLAGLATAMPPPGPARTAYIKKYQWDPAEKAPWLTKLKSTVESVWSAGGRFEFFVNQPDWEWVGAKVKIDIQVAEKLSSGGTDAPDGRELQVPARREPLLRRRLLRDRPRRGRQRAGPDDAARQHRRGAPTGRVAVLGGALRPRLRQRLGRDGRRSPARRAPWPSS